MAWIELHDNLSDHDKTVLCAHLLKIDRDALAGKLGRLWAWALNNRRTGFIPFHDMETVAEKMRWTKKPQALFDALCAVPSGYAFGFLERAEGGYLIHDWDEYTHKYYAQEKAREKDRNRKRKSKDDSIEEAAGFAAASVRIPSEEARNSVSYRNPNRNPNRNPVSPTTSTTACANAPLDAGAESGFAEAALACAQAGIEVFGETNRRQLGRMIAQYGLPWVIAAAERTAEKPTAKRHIGMLEGIMRDWTRLGGIDSPADKAQSQPVKAQSQPVKAAIVPMTPEEKRAFEEAMGLRNGGTA